MHKSTGWASVAFDWNRTRGFLITAEEGSFSAAAKALNMAQPTLSRQVAALEKDLGVTLFERGGQRLVLTQSGQELLLHAKQMASAAEKFSLTAAGHSQQLEGLVTISAGHLDAVYRLPKVIKKVKQRYPGIDIEIVVTNGASDLNRREADIAIRNFRPSQPELIAKKLDDENIWLVGTQQYLSPFKDIENVKDLNDIQIIGFEQDKQMIDILNQQGWELSQKNVQVVTEFQPMQIQLCKQDLGVIFLSEYAEKFEPSLTRVLASCGPIMTLPVWLVCHQELRTNLRVRKVFDLISDMLVD
jgi:DNA-binding transcriptional LysR family regulator